jgi:hypothetical protein
VTSALRAIRCTTQNQPANDVLDAKAIELQTYDPAQCEGHDRMPVEHEVAVVADLTCVDPSASVQRQGTLVATFTPRARVTVVTGPPRRRRRRAIRACVNSPWTRATSRGP